MKRNPFRFFVEIYQQPAWAIVWINILTAVNLASIAFLDSPEGRLILATYAINTTVMLALYRSAGMGKILGAAHALWVPLLIYLWPRAVSASTGPLRVYLLVFCAIATVSLAFDLSDVVQALRSRNAPRVD
mgnify:FL=1